MGELGEVLGWITGGCFIAALCNYVLKRINKMWVSGMPKESKFRAAFQWLLKFIVKNHRYFGIIAAIVVCVHLPVQIFGAWASVSGIAAAVLLLTTAVMGVEMLYGHKKGLLKIHRYAAAAALLAFVLHLIIKL